MERPFYDCVLTLGFLITPAGALTQTLECRVLQAVKRYKAGHTTKIVMSGGRVDSEPRTAAEAMRKYASNQGIPQSDIIEQSDALDTVGEAVFARLLLPRPLLGRRMLVVTSKFHADRAGAIFRFVFGPQFCVEIDRVPNGPASETASADREKKSLQRFQQLFSGIAAGDASAILDRFWQGHMLYQDAYFRDLRRRTSAALAHL
jgi:uncharacterized SAM-binding protein YcdF (DUF218 family)